VVALKELAEGTENKDILTDFEENKKRLPIENIFSYS
jgi:hypothetical protein